MAIDGSLAQGPVPRRRDDCGLVLVGIECRGNYGDHEQDQRDDAGGDEQQGLEDFQADLRFYSLATPNGTCPVVTWRLADSTGRRWPSKKMSPPKAFRNGPLSSPPRTKASSMRMFQALSVRPTRSRAGALPAVTLPVAMG